MKTIQLTQYGKVEIGVQGQEVAMPVAAADEIVIKVAGSSINPVDWKVANGVLKEVLPITLPVTLGWDVAGEVVEVGKDVTQFTRGDRVYGMPEIGKHGAFAEYVAVRAADMAPAPSSIPLSQAAAYPLAAQTAWQALFNAGQLNAGQRVLIHAGAGGVGHLAIQFAKAKGAYVITTTSAKNVDFVKQLGADEVIDYQSQDFAQALEASSVDLVFDTLGGEVQQASVEVIKPQGRLVTIVGIDPKAETLAKTKQVNPEFLFVQSAPADLATIASLIDSGTVEVTIAQTFPLADVPQALALSEAGRVRGKLVIEVNAA
ncbi:NADP-dependent oxidoreductase [Motilimonas eburnea]|uniref:NADP-dependent oxidoreductase n=1 Tax=Motilimonas eburnea TaxID=1737488 RepID=UPI001E35D39D|nr:NADP-dependent oxidoreductase [Motilimonas eburnea]MCE2572918.1 NADP-dependent oxidoreductase [Motilimonas eburnea]